jgi:hypothetical protein
MSETQKASDKHDDDSADNAACTSTLAAPTGGMANFVTCIGGGFDSSVIGKTLQLKDGSTVIQTFIVYESLALVFPNPIKTNGAANLVLAASGTGGVTGYTTISGYEG